MQLSRLKNSSCLQAYCEQNINIQIFTLTPLNSPGCKLYNGILVCYNNIFKIQVQVSRFPRVGRLQEKARVGSTIPNKAEKRGRPSLHLICTKV